MGTRGNIGITQFQSANLVWLYTHWNGGDIANVLQRALARGAARWDDGPYLARIIFEEMIGADRGGLTGFGITTGPAPDANVHYLVADTTTKTVKMVRKRNPNSPPMRTWTFEEFVRDGCPDFEDIPAPAETP